MMFLYVAWSLLIIALLESASIEGTECQSNMRNIAVYEGDEDIMLNLTSDTNNVWWKLVPTSDEFSTITIQGNRSYRDPSFLRLFYPNERGLVITNATATPGEYPISTSGLYIAQCLDSVNMTAAKLLVVTSAPSCSCNGSSPEVVQLSCSIVYADFTLHPINANMTWTIGDVAYTADTPRRTRINYFVYESISTIAVENSVSANVTCTVTFNEPTDIEYDFIATNAPEFSASCSVEVCATTTTSTTLATSTTPSPTTTTLSSTTKTTTPSTTTTTTPSTTTTTTKTPSTTTTTTKTPSTTTTTTKTPSTTTTPLPTTTTATTRTPSTTATRLSSSTTMQTPSTTTLLQRRTTPLKTTLTPIITIPPPTSTTETPSSSTASIGLVDQPSLTSKRYTKVLSTTTTVAPSSISTSTTKAPETYSVFDQPTLSKRYTKVLSTTTTARTAISSTKAIRDDDHQ